MAQPPATHPTDVPAAGEAPARLTVAILAAGAAGMYCGSCIRDNALALALRRLGHDALMIPLYTPVKTDTENASSSRVFYGGVNVWLQHASRLFRHTPRFINWLFDRPRFLTWAGNFGAQTSPAQLGDFTLDILRGEAGGTGKEIHRLIDFLKSEIKPSVVSLPNLMFIGLARQLKRELGVPVILELTGEDIFLDAMAEPHKSQARKLIAEKAQDVDRFIATSRYYAGTMADYMGIDAGKIEVVYPGVPIEYLKDTHAGESGAGNGGGELTIGYLARICPEKGLDKLIEAVMLLRERPGFAKVKVRAAGYLGKAHEKWYRQLERRIAGSNLAGGYHYDGAVEKAGKLALLDAADVFCAPAVYAEPKGIYVLEAMARGTPVVEPHHGAFPELVTETGSGLTTLPGDAAALAEALGRLLDDGDARRGHGRAGLAAVRDRFLDHHMAARMVEVYNSAMGRSAAGNPGHGSGINSSVAAGVVDRGAV